MRLAILASALVLLAAPAAAQDSALASGPPQPVGDDTLPAPVFRAHEPLELTLITDLGALKKDRTGEPEWQAGTLRLSSGDSMAIRVRARGFMRRKNCDLPPLRLDLPRGKAKETALSGLNKFKLVVHCRDTDRFESYVVEEYLIYRAYALLTPMSQRARLARITYVDARGRSSPDQRWAILLEDDDDVAKRNGLRVLEAKGAGPADIESYNSILVGVFQYLIGNTDWSIVALHNMALLQGMKATYAMAFDFDYAGIIATRYAVPDPRLGIRDVRERIYRGFCTREDRWDEVVAHVLSKREAIRALYEQEPALSDRERKGALQYLDDGFAVLADPERRTRLLKAQCRG